LPVSLADRGADSGWCSDCEREPCECSEEDKESLREDDGSAYSLYTASRDDVKYFMGEFYSIDDAKAEAARVAKSIEPFGIRIEQNGKTIMAWKEGFPLDYPELLDEGDWDDAVRAGPAAPGGLKDCPDCRGQYPNCERCAGAGMVWNDELDEEPGDWDHGYNYEGMGNIDDETCQTCNGTGEGEFVEKGVTTYCPDCKWMDPAGGLHDKDEEDPAAMYEGDYADCPHCGGTGSESASGNPLARNFDDDKCTLCSGSGQTDYVKGSRQDPFSGNYNVGVEDFMDPEDYERGDIH